MIECDPMKFSQIWFISLAVWLTLLPTPSIAQTESRKELLRHATTFMYQLQNTEQEQDLNALAQTEYDILVLEPVITLKGEQSFLLAEALNRLRHTPEGKRRLLLAYADIGEAEDYRSYWKRNWRAPRKHRKGKPSFILAADPDGWSGDYPVAYWDKAWKKLWLGSSGIVQRLAAAGFDGIYLDWIAAYELPAVRKEARRKRKNPAVEIVRFINEIRRQGQSVTPDFLVIGQNAPELLNAAPEYSSVIDAAAFEDSWFRGEADADWNSAEGGDISSNTADEFNELIDLYRKYQTMGLPVLTVDYCLSPQNAAYVYSHSRSLGFIPLVTRVSLSHLTPTPPPEL